MTSMPSPPSSDDFCLIDFDTPIALPIRSKTADGRSTETPLLRNMDDDFLLVSRPGSVVSLQSRSTTPVNTLDVRTSHVPFPSPQDQQLQHVNDHDRSTVSGDTDSTTTWMCGTMTLRMSEAGTRKVKFGPLIDNTCAPNPINAYSQTQTKCHEQHTDHYQQRRVPGPGSVGAVWHSNPPSHNSIDSHDELDKAIMDRLIDHALWSQHGLDQGVQGLTDKQLAQQMLVRLMALPTTHPVVQELSTVKPAMFHPIYRDATERAAVFDKVFTDVERAALTLVLSCHRQRFETTCIFAEVEHNRGQTWLETLTLPTLRRANDLARETSLECVLGMVFPPPPPFWSPNLFDFQQSTINEFFEMLEKLQEYSSLAYTLRLFKNRIRGRFQSKGCIENMGKDNGYACMAMIEIFEKTFSNLPELKVLHEAASTSQPSVRSSIQQKRVISTEPAGGYEDCVEQPAKRMSIPGTWPGDIRYWSATAEAHRSAGACPGAALPKTTLRTVPADTMEYDSDESYLPPVSTVTLANLQVRQPEIQTAPLQEHHRQRMYHAQEEAQRRYVAGVTATKEAQPAAQMHLLLQEPVVLQCYQKQIDLLGKGYKKRMQDLKCDNCRKRNAECDGQSRDKLGCVNCKTAGQHDCQSATFQDPSEMKAKQQSNSEHHLRTDEEYSKRGAEQTAQFLAGLRESREIYDPCEDHREKERPVSIGVINLSNSSSGNMQSRAVTAAMSEHRPLPCHIQSQKACETTLTTPQTARQELQMQTAARQRAHMQLRMQQMQQMQQIQQAQQMQQKQMCEMLWQHQQRQTQAVDQCSQPREKPSGTDEGKI